jgi:hypothetical protein
MGKCHDITQHGIQQYLPIVLKCISFPSRSTFKMSTFNYLLHHSTFGKMFK